MSFEGLFKKRNKSDLANLERSLSKEKLSVGERVKRLERSKGMQVILWVTLVILLLYVVFALLYSTAVVYASGTATSFLWFWPVTCVMALVAVLLLFLVLTGRLPRFKTTVMCFCILFWLCVVVFISVEAVVFSAGRRAPADDAEYVVILGAQVRGEVPTLVLNARINAAAEYLDAHPNAVAVASGGKGIGETISEAEAIRRGLVRRGISEERILMEDCSTSTAENLRYTAEVIQNFERRKSGEEEEIPLCGTFASPIRIVSKNVVLVTNDFHVFRAVKLAKNLGYTNVSGLGATEFFAVTIQYYVREFFAIGKEILSGNF